MPNFKRWWGFALSWANHVTRNASTFWLALIPLLLAWAVVYLAGFSDDAIRRAGLVLQILGFGIAAWQIESRRRSFGYPNVARSIGEWWRSGPEYTRMLHMKGGSGLFETTPGRASLRAPAANGTTEQRLDFLTREVDSLRDNLEDIADRHRKLASRLDSEIEKERQERREALASLDEKTAAAVAAGYGKEWAGVVHFVVGVILATIPGEIECLLSTC